MKTTQVHYCTVSKCNRFHLFACWFASLLLLVTVATAESLCDTPARPSHWKLAGARGHQHPVFVRNIINRACALHSGKGRHTGWKVSIDGARGWEETALVLTAAATDAFIRDSFLQLTGRLPYALSAPDGACDLGTGCLFAHPEAAVTTAPSSQTTGQTTDVWNSQRVINHYLRGAGLLWLREKTTDASGCHLAAVFARLHLQPTEAFKNITNMISEEVLSNAYDNVVVANVDSSHVSVHTLKESLQDGGSTGVWLVGKNAREGLIPKHVLPSNVKVHTVKTDHIPASVRSAVWAFIISHSTHYIGDLEPLYVKIGLVLGLGNFAVFPKISAGKSLWNDAYGFASCTAEEFSAHMKVASGKAGFQDVFKLPPQPPLPAMDWVSQKPAPIGRNSGKELCTNVTLDSGRYPISVDELVRKGRISTDGCNGSKDPPLCSVSEVKPTFADPNSHEFVGAFNETVRDAEYAGTSDTQRCGFQAQSGFSLLAASDQFKECKVVVATMVSRGRDVLVHPANVSPQTLEDPRVCFIAAMDVKAMVTHGLRPPSDGSLMKHGYWTVAALLNSPWAGSTEVPWLLGARDANVLKHLRFRIFPNAEYSMWIDGKHQLAVDPVKLLDDVLAKPQKHTAVFHHENQRCLFAQHATVRTMPWAQQVPGYVERVDALTARYHKEGMPSEADGSPQGAHDLAVILNHHIMPSNMLACLAYTEIESFTSRNELSYPYTVWRANAKSGLNELPHCALYMYTHAVGHWTGKANCQWC